MSPGKAPATQRHSAIKSPSRAPPRRSTRSQAVRSSRPPAVASSPPEPVQSSLPAYPIDTLQYRGQKRKTGSEDECPNKRLQRSPQPASESSQPLSEGNLARHNRLLRLKTSGDMDSGTAASERGGLKRPRSRQSSTTDVDRETASARSQLTYTAAHYRFHILQPAKILIRHGALLEEEVQHRIDEVIRRKISEERELEISRIANTLYSDFLDVLDRPSREDDCIEPIYRALFSLDSGQKLGFLRKADWHPSLKPSAPPKISRDFSFLYKPSGQADDTATSPRRRQQVDTPPSGASQPAMAPPPTPTRPKQDNVAVKTPRPDLTVGLRLSSMTTSLVAEGLSQVTADEFLQELQQLQTLCSDPTQQAHSICFPPMVVEGKSYATGKPVFEAQNQASVSGSCMTNLQHQLAELAHSASPGSCRSNRPLAFSICTEGPHLELWVHYTLSRDGVRTYNMNIVKACHTSLPNGVVEFLTVVDSIMSWASVDFVKELAEQLVLVEKASRVQCSN